MTIRQFAIKTHRCLGAILSLLFVLWFLSAFVLIYYHYPKYKPSERLKHSPLIAQEALSAKPSLSTLEDLFHQSYPKETIKSISLQSSLRMGLHYELVSALGHTYYYSLDLKEQARNTQVDAEYMAQVAQLWGQKVLSIDTLYSLDQWTPFSRLRSDLPFYRLNLSGDDVRQVYLSSHSGEILTEHSRSERLGAYFGAIPHWVYFTAIRQNVDLWIWLIIILSGFGVFMVLTGIYVGVDMMKLARGKKKPELSPYRKKSYRWHHIMGTFFGVFVLSWIFSGLMSVVDVPDVLVGKEDLRGNKLYESQTLELEAWNQVDIQELHSLFPEGIRRIKWNTEFYKPSVAVVDVEGKEHRLTYEGGHFKPFALDEYEVRKLIEQTYLNKSYRLSRIREYDGYYSFKGENGDDFAWKVEVDTEGSPVVYIDNATARVQIINYRSRLNQWLYKKTHTLKFVVLKRNPWLWTSVVWILLIIGLFISITGFMMSFPYFKRVTNAYSRSFKNFLKKVC